jgi:hypothetical protein
MAARGVRAATLAAVIAGVLALLGCGAPRGQAAIAYRRTTAPTPGPTTAALAPPTPSATPATTAPGGSRSTGSGGSGGSSDGVPANGSGTFTVAPGGTDVVGAGATLVTYRTEVEDGISWGNNPVWTPDSFGADVDAILADPRGWTASAAHPVTDAGQHMNGASWSFQRVSGGSFSVRLLLATPGTVDRMCGSIGLQTVGQYSCSYGNVILINLRRWLRGAPGFPIDLTGYHTMVINHEMGHRLGFQHMRCPAKGVPAPVMMQQTMDIGGCLPNAYPFSPDGTFIDGPYAP